MILRKVLVLNTSWLPISFPWEYGRNEQLGGKCLPVASTVSPILQAIRLRAVVPSWGVMEQGSPELHPRCGPFCLPAVPLSLLWAEVQAQGLSQFSRILFLQLVYLNWIKMLHMLAVYSTSWSHGFILMPTNRHSFTLYICFECLVGSENAVRQKQPGFLALGEPLSGEGDRR